MRSVQAPPSCDIQREAITGQSFGGYGTASIISGTNLFRAAVAVSGIYDLAGTYGYMDPDGCNVWVGWAEGGQARMGTDRWANLNRYFENSRTPCRPHSHAAADCAR
jgi:dipeptidyl aminopeptidase/acylaminoacyl peptidase